MSPVNYTTTQLRQLVYYNLDCNNLQNALFLAGRLHAYEPRASEAAYLVAQCHLRLNQYKAAYDYSKNYGSRATHLGCAYVFAQACLGLGRYAEGISALDKSRMHWISRNNWGKHTETRRQHVPDAAAVWCLQGKLFQAFKQPNRAVECFVEALKLNPLMWDAFIALCDLGLNPRTPNIFKITPDIASTIMANGNDDGATSVSGESVHSAVPHSNASDPFSIPTNKVNGELRQQVAKSALYEKLNGSTSIFTPLSSSNGHDTMETPLAPGVSLPGVREPTLASGDEAPPIEAPQAPARKVHTGLGMVAGDHAPPRMKASTLRSKSRADPNPDEMDIVPAPQTLGLSITDRKRTASGHPPQNGTSVPLKDAGAQNPPDPMAPQRRSVRILNSITKPQNRFSSTVNGAVSKESRELKKARITGTKGRANTSTVGRVVSGNRKYEPPEVEGKEIKHSTTTHHPPAATQKPQSNEKLKEMEGVQALLDLFAELGRGYLALSNYRCQEAYRIFNNVHASQRDTPWVLSQMARSLFEQGSWAEAEKVYIRIRTIAPARLEDLELYSTVLWHLKKDVELSYLAHELIDVDRLSPQAWCIVGNSFALQREHDQALKCFKRATQLDPKFAYAHTLQGHEHVSNEEYDKAMAAYRSAVEVEARHYNGWYGLAKVYERQGKYEMAEAHYRQAASINPTHAVLICCIGEVLERMKKPQQALDQYTRSSELAPKSTLARFKKARILMALRQPEMALEELVVLRDIAPDEANVHFFLGRVYKSLRQKGNAVKHFTTALSLDPKVHEEFLIVPLLTNLSLRHPIKSKKPWSRWRTKLMKTS